MGSFVANGACTSAEGWSVSSSFVTHSEVGSVLAKSRAMRPASAPRSAAGAQSITSMWRFSELLLRRRSSPSIASTEPCSTARPEVSTMMTSAVIPPITVRSSSGEVTAWNSDSMSSAYLRSWSSAPTR